MKTEQGEGLGIVALAYAAVTHGVSGYARACNCIGPQNGQPVCPCQMRNVEIKDGRYVRTQDLGPAPEGVRITAEALTGHKVLKPYWRNGGGSSC